MCQVYPPSSSKVQDTEMVVGRPWQDRIDLRHNHAIKKRRELGV
jgi:hypothetical protein